MIIIPVSYRYGCFLSQFYNYMTLKPNPTPKDRWFDRLSVRNSNRLAVIMRASSLLVLAVIVCACGAAAETTYKLQDDGSLLITEPFLAIVSECSPARIARSIAYVSPLSKQGMVEVRVCNTGKLKGDYTMNITCFAVDPCIPLDTIRTQSTSISWNQSPGCETLGTLLFVDPAVISEKSSAVCNITLSGCPDDTYYAATSTWIQYLTLMFPPFLEEILGDRECKDGVQRRDP